MMMKRTLCVGMGKQEKTKEERMSEIKETPSKLESQEKENNNDERTKSIELKPKVTYADVVKNSVVCEDQHKKQII